MASPLAAVLAAIARRHAAAGRLSLLLLLLALLLLALLALVDEDGLARAVDGAAGA